MYFTRGALHVAVAHQNPPVATGPGGVSHHLARSAPDCVAWHLRATSAVDNTALDFFFISRLRQFDC